MNFSKWQYVACQKLALEALQHNNLSLEEVKLFIPHQANMRIIKAVASRIGLPPEKVYTNVHKYGNTSSASIPIALDEANRKGMLHPHDLLLFDTFGGGLTWGAMVCPLVSGTINPNLYIRGTKSGLRYVPLCRLEYRITRQKYGYLIKMF